MCARAEFAGAGSYAASPHASAAGRTRRSPYAGAAAAPPEFDDDAAPSATPLGQPKLDFLRSEKQRVEQQAEQHRQADLQEYFEMHLRHQNEMGRFFFERGMVPPDVDDGGRASMDISPSPEAQRKRKHDDDEQPGDDNAGASKRLRQAAAVSRHRWLTEMKEAELKGDQPASSPDDEDYVTQSERDASSASSASSAPASAAPSSAAQGIDQNFRFDHPPEDADHCRCATKCKGWQGPTRVCNGSHCGCWRAGRHCTTKCHPEARRRHRESWCLCQVPPLLCVDRCQEPSSKK